jgi:hypothetical protein
VFRAFVTYIFWQLMAAIDDELHAIGIDWIWFCQWATIGYCDISWQLGVDYVSSDMGWPWKDETTR